MTPSLWKVQTSDSLKYVSWSPQKMNSQVHTNTLWSVLNLWDQMKTPLFHRPSIKSVSIKRWGKGLLLTSCLIKIIGCWCWQYNWNSDLQWIKAIKVVRRNYQVRLISWLLGGDESHHVKSKNSSCSQRASVKNIEDRPISASWI
jgi:hypothetical protein